MVLLQPTLARSIEAYVIFMVIVSYKKANQAHSYFHTLYDNETEHKVLNHVKFHKVLICHHVMTSTFL